MLQTQEGKNVLNALPLDKLSMLINGYDEAVGVTNSQNAGFINQHFDTPPWFVNSRTTTEPTAKIGGGA
jgi:hypothetical protein